MGESEKSDRELEGWRSVPGERARGADDSNEVPAQVDRYTLRAVCSC